MGIRFFRKNKIDLDFSGASITATDATATDNGSSFVNFLRNRDNMSGWATTGSNDAANTQLDFDLGAGRSIDSIILVEMNFAAYTIQYSTDGISYSDFSTPISVSGNSTATKIHEFDSVNARYYRLIITGTFVADADKFMTQFIITEALGEFSFQPRVKPVLDRNRRAVKYLSGKSHVIKQVENFGVEIEMQNVTGESDLSLVETLFASYEGFLVWLSGGTTNQFTTIREGWRLKDIPLCNVVNEYQPEWEDSRYNWGMPVKLRLVEVV